MLKNYLKIAYRNLLRHKAFSLINIFGLSIGIATCLIIMLFIQNELSYDRFNKKADRIVRVVFKGSIQNEKMNESHVMPPVAQTLLREYPEVLEATRLRQYGMPRVIYGDKSFRENAFAFVDPNFFQVFTLPFTQGNSKTALIEPNTVVISEAVAQKFFGNENPIGKALNFKSLNANYKVTGVIKNMPTNSHFHFDLLASMASHPDSKSSSWMTSEFFTYLVLPENFDYKKLETKLPQVVEKYMGPQLKQAMGMSFDQFREKGNDLGLFLQPLTDIHLRADSMFELEPGGDIRNIYIFGAIAMFMLLIACINFMNLSTAGASKRAREVGIRKVLGSEKMELIKQFLLESLLITAIALLLSLVFVLLALPIFNSISGQDLSFDILTNPYVLPALLFFGLIVGILAGSYPAFFLSSFKPVSVLKGKIKSGKNSVGLRSGLVVFQFFISITLIVCTTVVYKQLSYIQNKELGYNKENVLILPETHVLGKNQEVFQKRILQDSRVINISNSGYLPAGPSYYNNFTVSPDDNPSLLIKTLKYDIDEQYIPVLGMKILEGRNFSKEFSTDSSGVIINETAARMFGWEKNALGRTLTYSQNDGKKINYRVIGLVKDFHFKSLHEHISPLVMVLDKNSGTLIVKVKNNDIPGLLSSLKKQWTEYNAEEPFLYAFLDDRFYETYQSEQKIAQILGIFAVLTILVACLGLFGLATFTTQERTKEIGIRKVLGASIVSVTSLLSKDFIKLVLIAILLATPIAWFFMNKWLQDFAYRIEIQWWVFALAASISILIAFVTISFQAIKAAVANPVKSLRSE